MGIKRRVLLKQLADCLATPQDDPLFHVIFSPGYKDRVGLQTNSKRANPPPHWLGLVTSKAMKVFHQQVTQDPKYPSHSRKDFLGLVQYLRDCLSYSSKLVAAPTREAQLFFMYIKSIPKPYNPKPLKKKCRPQDARQGFAYLVVLQILASVGQSTLPLYCKRKRLRV